MIPRRTALIDGDVVAYKAAAACQKNHHWEDDIISIHVDVAEAKRVLDNIILDIKLRTGADNVLIALTDRGKEFRRDLWPDYKGNRKGPKPLGLSAMNDHMSAEYDTFLRPKLEADDVLGILATYRGKLKNVPIYDERVIVTTDKDLAQIPGMHFNPDKDEDIRTVTQAEGDRFFRLQCLTGDATDNYPGCPGIGPVKAEAIIAASTDDDWWLRVVAAYAAKGLTEEDALIQARLARILQAQDYDFKKGETILWTPTSSAN